MPDERHQCPTCGASVTVSEGAGGTAFYLPDEVPDKLDTSSGMKEELRETLLREEAARLRDEAEDEKDLIGAVVMRDLAHQLERLAATGNA
jgi:ssDNA-binding Zn-finger/Zn-ribbon topoisomerase 1